MTILFLTPLAIVSAGVAAFLFGWIWYSPFLFKKWWLDGLSMKHDPLAERKKKYRFQVMAYTFFIGTIMSAVIAIILEVAQVESLKQSLALVTIISVGIVGLRNFSGMLYTTPETYYSVRAQKKFFVDSGYYVGMFALATIVMYYVGTSFGA
jgi:hypothetical protein